jgi:hypothetical protein
MNMPLQRWLAAAVAAIAPSLANAQLIDCDPPEAGTLVVFLNEPEFTQGAFASRAEMMVVFDRLQKHLDQREDLEAILSPDVPVRVARCDKRTPAIDGKDFASASLVDSLNSRGVLLEIWGMLDAGPKAQINYLLVPVRNSANLGETSVSSLLRFNYPMGEIAAADYVDLLSNADLHAFVATSLGAKALKQRRFELAHEYHCKAGPRLLRIQERLGAAPATVPQAQGIERLRVYVTELAGRAVEGAQRQPSTPAHLKLQKASNPCGERRTP